MTTTKITPSEQTGTKPTDSHEEQVRKAKEYVAKLTPEQKMKIFRGICETGDIHKDHLHDS